ncbi:DUF2835 domain-containing protein [Halomonas sp. CH40]
MPSIDIVLHLSYDECLAHYEGRIGNVRTRSLDGRWVIFPAEAIRRVVSRDGVHGAFRLHFSDEGKFVSIKPLAARR